MSVTDTYVLNDLVYKMLENGKADAAFPSMVTAMFTPQELIDTLNRVQQDFMLTTGMVITRTPIAAQTGKALYDLPADSIRPRRLTWTGTDLQTRVLTQSDTWELDNGDLASWQQSRGVPIAWQENQLQQQQIGIAPLPNTNGSIGLLYVALAQTLTGLGVTFTVPDDWTPYIMYGAIADLLASDGDAYDPARAEYAQRRYDEGIELARLVLGGSW